MKNLLFLLIVSQLAISTSLLANDSEFYMSGNHLVPVYQTRIAVKKEILSIKNGVDGMVQVDVYYEFFNPDNEKEILVGFESQPGSNEEEFSPSENGENPDMKNFTVQANGVFLQYNVTYVLYKDYTKVGIIKKGRSKNEMSEKYKEDGFTYVHYFKVKFKRGLNIIKHSYDFRPGNSVAYHPYFILASIPYVLTSAMRWGNKQIDDFTLLIDLGNNLFIEKSFFKNTNDWNIVGIGKINNNPLLNNDFSNDNIPDFEKESINFIIERGVLCFKKNNFKPTGEISIYQIDRLYQFDELGKICSDKNYFEEYKDKTDSINEEPIDSFQRLVLENLPFARKGLIFSDKELKKYFENKDWYYPNPYYKKNIEALSEEERKWIEKWKKK